MYDRLCFSCKHYNHQLGTCFINEMVNGEYPIWCEKYLFVRWGR